MDMVIFGKKRQVKFMEVYLFTFALSIFDDSVRVWGVGGTHNDRNNDKN